MEHKTHKGIYYFPTYRAAHTFAFQNGYPTNRIINYSRGWAIQGGISGDYAGPHGLKIGDWYPRGVDKPLRQRKLPHGLVLIK